MGLMKGSKTKKPNLASGIYTGSLQHCRYFPKHHFFQYQVFMMYLDLDELGEVFKRSWLWSCKRFALAWLRRKDFLGDPSVNLKDSVVAHIKTVTGNTFNGRVRMLANLRYFGFQMNPIVSYYCFNEHEELEYIVAEVTNTPWRERHAYVLTCDKNSQKQNIRFDKTLHVSPFNDLNFTYQWHSDLPGDDLNIRLANWRGDKKQFEANLQLRRKEITTSTLRNTILKFPFMTMKVFAAIYWQAAKLFIKGVPFVNHPGNKIEELPQNTP